MNSRLCSTRRCTLGTADATIEEVFIHSWRLKQTVSIKRSWLKHIVSGNAKKDGGADCGVDTSVRNSIIFLCVTLFTEIWGDLIQICLKGRNLGRKGTSDGAVNASWMLMLPRKWKENGYEQKVVGQLCRTSADTIWNSGWKSVIKDRIPTSCGQSVNLQRPLHWWILVITNLVLDNSSLVTKLKKPGPRTTNVSNLLLSSTDFLY